VARSEFDDSSLVVGSFTQTISFTVCRQTSRVVSVSGVIRLYPASSPPNFLQPRSDFHIRGLRVSIESM
jgi:hypothetical protein